MEMVLSQTTWCALRFGDIKSIELIAQAGFDAVDYCMSGLFQKDGKLKTDEYKDYAALLVETAKKNGVYFNQGHAVFQIPDSAADGHKALIDINKRAIEVASLMGMKTLVIHPVSLGQYIGREDIVFEENMKYFQALLPCAEKYGVKLACENAWCWDDRIKIIRGSVCANPFEHAKYVDEMDSEMFVACLDVGHCSLSGREAQDCIRVLGDRLQALHIHDNDYRDDMHTLPGLCEMNWEEITKALADIKYKGDFTLETDRFFDSLETEEETVLGLKLSELIGRKLIRKIEKNS